MKTLRKILFERYEGADPELESICRCVLTRMPGAVSSRPASIFLGCWQELFWSSRRAWTGFGAGST
jgi:hypothetical protein